MPIEQESRCFQLGEWLVDPARDVLQRGDESVKIEPKAMAVLCFLARRPGAVVAQAELEAAVWRNVIVTPQSVYQCIAQLRRVLRDNPREPRYIETIPRRGYRLVAAVEFPEPRADAIAMAPLADGTSDAPLSAVSAAARRKRLARPLAIGVVVTVLLLVTAASWFNAWPGSARPSQAGSIAVLQFSDLGTGREQLHLAAAITEELTSALGQVEGLEVIASNSARFAGARDDWDLRQVAAELGVAYVLKGNVRRVGDRVRVLATLIEAKTLREKWSRTFERPVAGVSRLPADIAGAAAGAIGHALVGDPGFRGSRIGTRSPSAFDFYTLGQQRFSERTATAIADAERYFQLAVDADPGFAAAYAALADVHIAEYYFAGRTLVETVEQMQPLVARALDLDPEYGQAHAMRGWIAMESGDYVLAEQELRGAVQLAPNDAKAWNWLAMTLHAVGRPDEALTVVDRALGIDPLNFIIHIRRALVLDTLGRAAEARESATRAVTLSPRHPNPRWTLALIAISNGELPLALAHYKTALVLDPSRSDLRTQYASYLLEAGRVAEARKELAEAARLAESSQAFMSAKALDCLVAEERSGLPELAASLASIEPGNRFFLADAASWMTLAGEHAKAVELFEGALAEHPAARLNDLFMIRLGMETVPGSLAISYDALGRHADRDRVLAQFERFLNDVEDHGMRSFSIDYQRAVIAAIRGQDEAALSHLERAAAAGWRRSWWARIDPAFTRLRGRMEFELLLDRVAAS